MVAYAVAEVECGGVGGVFNVIEPLLSNVGLYLLTGEREEGAYDCTITGWNAAQASETAATQEVDEECFGSIVAMVGGGDVVEAFFLTHILKEGVTLLACSLLNREMIATGMSLSIELGHMDCYPIVLGKRAHKGFVAVTVARAKMEVAVSYGKGEMCLVHEMKESDGVDASTDANQPFLLGTEKVGCG